MQAEWKDLEPELLAANATADKRSRRSAKLFCAAPCKERAQVTYNWVVLSPVWQGKKRRRAVRNRIRVSTLGMPVPGSRLAQGWSSQQGKMDPRLLTRAPIDAETAPKQAKRKKISWLPQVSLAQRAQPAARRTPCQLGPIIFWPSSQRSAG